MCAVMFKMLLVGLFFRNLKPLLCIHLGKKTKGKTYTRTNN